MPSFLDILFRYSVEAEWSLTWYPIRQTNNLDNVRMRGSWTKHSTLDGPFQINNKITYLVGQGASGDGDPLEKNRFVNAFVTFGVNSSRIFEVEVESSFGTAKRTKKYALQPNTITPFMMNVIFPDTHRELFDTKAVFQGVFTTTSRFSLFSDGIKAVIKIIGRSTNFRLPSGR